MRGPLVEEFRIVLRVPPPPSDAVAHVLA